MADKKAKTVEELTVELEASKEATVAAEALATEAEERAVTAEEKLNGAVNIARVQDPKPKKGKPVKVTCYFDVQIADDKYIAGSNYTVDAVRAEKYVTYFTDPNAK